MTDALVGGVDAPSVVKMHAMFKTYNRLGKQQNYTCSWSECTGLIIIIIMQMNVHPGDITVAI